MPKTLMPASATNSKGYFESPRIQEFNDHLLKDVRSSWRDWRPLRATWFASPAGKAWLPEAQEVLAEEFGGKPLVVLKDPRICRMVPFWNEVVEAEGYAARFILTIRNPMEVAQSLHTRDKILLAEGLLLWLRHVLDAEASTRGGVRYITSYESLLENWVGVATGLQQAFGFSLPQFDDSATQEIEEFLSRGLRHHAELPAKIIENPAISSWLREAYGIFERWVADGEQEEDYAQLDEIRRAFDVAAPFFGQLIDPLQTEHRRAIGELNEVRKQSEAARASLSAQENELAEARQALEAAETRGREQGAQAEEARQTFMRELGELRKSYDDDRIAHEDTVAELRDTQHRLTADLQGARDSISELQSALAQRRLEADEATERAASLQKELEQRAAEQGDLRKKVERQDRELSLATGEILKAQARQAEAATRWGRREAGLMADLRKARYAVAREEQQAAVLHAELESVTREKADAEKQAGDWKAESAQLASEKDQLSSLSEQKKQELARVGGLLKAAQLELEKQRREVTALAGAREKLRKELDEKTRTMVKQNETLSRLSGAMKEIRESTSWRITQPLRNIVDMVRGNR